MNRVNPGLGALLIATVLTFSGCASPVASDSPPVEDATGSSPASSPSGRAVASVTCSLVEPDYPVEDLALLTSTDGALPEGFPTAPAPVCGFSFHNPGISSVDGTRGVNTVAIFAALSPDELATFIAAAESAGYVFTDGAGGAYDPSRTWWQGTLGGDDDAGVVMIATWANSAVDGYGPAMDGDPDVVYAVNVWSPAG